ncbi:YwqG family protein [Listeria swaminathanii]|uniref:YwqG family protein n=1 Tax=Listeria swaminathanii TaxID=2713501 RepID=A0ABU2IIK8_9LIST|nr:YwqG family protein [Listeria swaminathanii]MCD2248755.1 DUF1963 domain-containing protein [Listeria marthii]MDT0018278.1 YwqG family protein [Listeria swaminathanii]MDT0023736.1 YwqG family protein [Listeria swaminathanii]MDT0034692.1 YwqG family protein [Listeria swaminathanii]MDT0053500.1 YwqG family protein [Listeria swaminathanii]
MEELFDILPSEWAERFLETEKERIELQFKDAGPLSLLQSKAGGRGYLPKEQGYPVTEEGKPLSLLAQINFSEMPQMENYPEFGLLAFYVDFQDDFYGLDYENPTSQEGFRVFFFDDLGQESYTKEEQEIFFDEVEKGDYYSLVNGEFEITGQISDQILLNDSCDFKNEFGDYFYELADQIFDEDADKSFALANLASKLEASQIGGYPFFIQDDPRVYIENAQQDTLLFQLNSKYNQESGKVDIMWGDCGVGNFFINKQDLINRDFSNILYNWDCS